MDLEQSKKLDIIKKNNLEIDRWNAIDYVKKLMKIDKNKKFTPIPDHILDSISNTIRKEKGRICDYIGVYDILYRNQDKFNTCNFPTRQKYQYFFGLTERTVNKILNKLERIGVIIQVKQNHKKVIFVKYPEYIDHINNSKITIEEEITERIITEKTTTKRVIIEPKEQNNKIIESKNYQEIPEPDQYSQEQIAKIQQDIKISTDNLSQGEIEKTIYNYLNEYVEWNNNIDKKSIIEKPVIFINKYLNNPLSIIIDFTQYYAYLKKLEKQKLIEENKKQLEKLEQEKKLKEKELDSLYKIFKKYDKNAYKKLYEKQKKSILETNQ